MKNKIIGEKIISIEGWNNGQTLIIHFNNGMSLDISGMPNIPQNGLQDILQIKVYNRDEWAYDDAPELLEYLLKQKDIKTKMVADKNYISVKKKK